MAIVQNLGDPTLPVDSPLDTPNRTFSMPVLASLTPLFSGEIIIDSVSSLQYIATSNATGSWALHTSTN